MDTSVLRRLCQEAIHDVAMLAMDVTFSTGELCSGTLFVDSGMFMYTLGKDEDISTLRASELLYCHKSSRPDVSPSRSATTADSTVITPGQCISEAAIWTKWTHCGQLSAIHDGVLLMMDSGEFALVL